MEFDRSRIHLQRYMLSKQCILLKPNTPIGPIYLLRGPDTIKVESLVHQSICHLQRFEKNSKCLYYKQ